MLRLCYKLTLSVNNNWFILKSAKIIEINQGHQSSKGKEELVSMEVNIKLYMFQNA